MAKSDYRKVASATQGIFFRSSLHLAKDHFLICKSSGLHREFQRFFYSDIQALSMQENAFSRTKTLVTISLIALSIVLLLVSSSGFVQFLSWSTLVLCLFILAFQVKHATGCKVVVETTANSAQLPALSRKRKALKVMDLLKERVEGIQGVLTDDVFQMQNQSPPERRARPAPQILAKATVWHWSHYGTWIALVALLGLTFNADFSSVAIALFWTFPVLAFVTGILGVAANFRARRKRAPLESVTYLSLVLVMVHAISAYFFISFQAISLGYSAGGLDIYKAFLDGSVYNQSIFFQYRNILMGVALILGATGLGLCMARGAAATESVP